MLGLVSIVFDVIFLLQHYYWYPEQRHPRVLLVSQEVNEVKLVKPVHSESV